MSRLAVKVEIVPATDSHALDLAQRLRLDDLREIWAAGRVTPHRALLRALRVKGEAWAGLADGRIVCMFGVTDAGGSTLARQGVPWLLGSTDLPDHATAFLRRNGAFIARSRREYRLLFNYVDCRNVNAIRWLRWLGFAIMSPEPHGPFGLPFCRFELRT